MGPVAIRGLGLALGGLRRLAELDALDRLNLRAPVQRAVRTATRTGASSAVGVGRTFARARRPGPARPTTASGPRRFDLAPTDEQRMLQDAFGEFATQRIRPAAKDADAAGAAPAALVAEAHQMGVLQLQLPTAFGGVAEERSSVTSVLALEALAHGDLSLSVAITAPAAAITALSLWGDGDQQATYLPPFAEDDPPVSAFAVTEPAAAADPLRPTTRARRTPDGFVLDGVKALVPRAAEAALVIVTADLDGVPALFLVETAAAGVTVAPDPAMGLRAAATGRLHLDAVTVPADALLGGGDPAVATEAIHRARLAWCAVALGTGRAVLDHVVPYVNDRVAFGEPISHRQAVAFAVADIATELEGMRLATYRAAALADRGEPVGSAVTTARILCGQHGARIGSQGVQLLGGHGFVTEHPVERWYRDLRAVSIAEGGLLL